MNFYLKNFAQAVLNRTPDTKFLVRRNFAFIKEIGKYLDLRYMNFRAFWTSSFFLISKIQMSLKCQVLFVDILITGFGDAITDLLQVLRGVST